MCRTGEQVAPTQSGFLIVGGGVEMEPHGFVFEMFSLFNQLTFWLSLLA